ncbi:MAG: hypothetical protein JXA67_02640, partial [Micromonosporaceae bacterium]|nr:hypothetical protein [Micromonosporaceae bacterium]
PTEDCGVADVACQVRQGLTSALAAGIRDGIQGLVDLVVQAFAWLLSKLAEMIFSNLSLGDPSDAFYDVYNQVAATLLILVTVFVIVSTIINGLRLGGPGPLSTLGGLVRAILGIIFAGGIAWTITKAWDEATVALIDHFAAQPWDASSWVNGVSALSSGAGTMFLALLVALFGLIGEILLIIMLLFRSLLAWGAALFGAMAMTGQVMAETRGWGRRWFWTVNALASSKFFIAAIWIYGSRAAYGSDSLITSLQALLMIWLMVAAPGVLLRLTTLWDGYLADVNAGSVLAAAGRGLDAINPLGGGGSGEAPETMQTASSGIPTIPDGAHVDGWTDPLGLGDDVATSADGEPAGDPSRAADRGQQEAGDPDQPQGQQPGRDEAERPNADDAGRPNADEAEATQAGTDAAHTDLTAGQLTAPTAPQTSHSTPDHDDDERSHDDDQRPPASASGARPASGATGDAAVAGEVPPIV